MAYVVKVKSRYRNDQTGKELLLPALLTEGGVIISHLRYLASKPGKSASWRERAAFAVMLLIKFINANQGQFAQTTELLRTFSQALVEGTIYPSSLEDPSGLFWSPRRLKDAASLLYHITDYTDWLAEQSDHEIRRANPFRRATSAEERLNWCAYYHKQGRVFLNHLADASEARRNAKYIRDIKTPNAPVVEKAAVKRFPEAEIRSLLEDGFVRPNTHLGMPGHERIDYKNQAIAMLMHYGGLRKSEVFHLYLSDIVLDPKRMEAVVRVFHPSNGEAPDEKYSNRKDFLAKLYRLRPRTEYHKSERLHLGWKAPLLTDARGFFQVNFFPPNMASEFLLAWTSYLKYQRVEPQEGLEHPYAFTNSRGCPETIKNFQRLHAAAVRRIGLEHRKYLGTTEHGHRHSYGYRLAENGLSQVEIQKAMHHKSPESCLVYIQPSEDELRRKMEGLLNG